MQCRHCLHRDCCCSWKKQQQRKKKQHFVVVVVDEPYEDDISPKLTIPTCLDQGQLPIELRMEQKRVVLAVNELAAAAMTSSYSRAVAVVDQNCHHSFHHHQVVKLQLEIGHGKLPKMMMVSSSWMTSFQELVPMTVDEK